MPGGMPRIVSDELWRKANDMAGKREGRAAAAPTTTSSREGWRAACAGGSYVGTSGRGKRGTVYHYYMCGGCGRRMPNGDRGRHSRRRAQALKDEETVRRIAAKVAEIANASGAERLDALEKRAAELEAKQANLVKAIEDGATSAAVFARLDAVEAELAGVKAQAKGAGGRRVAHRRRRAGGVLPLRMAARRRQDAAAYHGVGRGGLRGPARWRW